MPLQTTYNNNLPDISSLQSGDTVLFGDKITQSNPSIQKLIGAGNVSPYLKNGQLAGVNVLNQYTAPEAQFSYQSGPTGWGKYVQGEGSPGGDFTANPDYVAPNPYEEQHNQAQFQTQAPTGYEQYGQQYQDLLQAQQTALEAQYQQQVGNINEQYGQQIQQTKDVGGRSAGALSRILGRAGGFTTTAGGQAIVSQENALQGQVNQLESAKQQALQVALVAKETGNATAIQRANENLYKVQQDIKATQQQRASNLLALLDRMSAYDQKQQQAQVEAEQAEAELEFDQQQAEIDLAKDKQKFEKDMLDKGWKYVNTPKKRDELKAEGYEMVEIGGRTYAKPKKLTKSTYHGVTRFYDELGNLVKTEGTFTGTTTPDTTLTSEEKKFEKDLTAQQRKLANGGSWADSWNFLHNLYPGASNEQLDAMLDKDKYYSQQ